MELMDLANHDYIVINVMEYLSHLNTDNQQLFD
jgi:hypothetical protein